MIKKTRHLAFLAALGFALCLAILCSAFRIQAGRSGSGLSGCDAGAYRVRGKCEES